MSHKKADKLHEQSSFGNALILPAEQATWEYSRREAGRQLRERAREIARTRRAEDEESTPLPGTPPDKRTKKQKEQETSDKQSNPPPKPTSFERTVTGLLRDVDTMELRGRNVSTLPPISRETSQSPLLLERKNAAAHLPDLDTKTSNPVAFLAKKERLDQRHKHMKLAKTTSTTTLPEKRSSSQTTAPTAVIRTTSKTTLPSLSRNPSGYFSRSSTPVFREPPKLMPTTEEQKTYGYLYMTLGRLSHKVEEATSTEKTLVSYQALDAALSYFTETLRKHETLYNNKALFGGPVSHDSRGYRKTHWDLFCEIQEKYRAFQIEKNSPHPVLTSQKANFPNRPGF